MWVRNICAYVPPYHHSIFLHTNSEKSSKCRLEPTQTPTTSKKLCRRHGPIWPKLERHGVSSATCRDMSATFPAKYHGPDDLRTLTMRQVQDDILAQTLQDGPYDLQPASFNLTTARTDSMALQSEIEGKTFRLAYPMICNTLFLELCPGYSNQPHAALDHIRQVHHDRDGNQVVSTVQAYFQQLMNASRPFSSQQEFPISVCQKFQDGLDPRLITGFHRFFSDHSVVQSLASTHQRKILQQMLSAAQQAEDEYASTQRIAREAIGLS